MPATPGTLPRRLFLALLLASGLASAAHADARPKDPIRFESDHLEYREAEQVIVASGNVVVRQSSYTFRSDLATFDLPHKHLEASGRVRFDDVQGNEIRSRFLTYDADTGASQLDEAEGSFGPWLFATEEIVRDKDGNFTLKRARLSTCENDLSKYHLYGYKIRILPHRRLTVQNALFRIGPVPVLYLPYYYYSLGEKHLSFQFFPGQNQSEGFFLRTIWGYPTTDDTYLKVYLDELTRRGIGTGGEFNYYFGDTAKGSLYGYRINDRLTDRSRWNARLYHWQQLSPHWIMQSDINQLSDPDFPNDFFREDYNRVVTNPLTNAAVTFSTGSFFLRTVAERQDIYDITQNKFISGQQLAPSVTLNQTQGPLFLGFDRTWSLSAVNRFSGNGPYLVATSTPDQFGLVPFTPVGLDRNYRREVDAQFSVIRQVRITRLTTFVPKITVDNFWTDRPQGAEPPEHSVQRVGTESTLRQRLANWDFDLTYLYTQRLEQNRGLDQGRENHQLNFLAWYYPGSWLSVRLDTSYTLPHLKGEPLAFLDRRRYQPLRGEATFIPQEKWELFFREEYALYDPNTTSAHALSTETELLYGRRELGENYFLIGSSYFSSQDHQFELRNGARFSLFRWLQLEGTIRTLLSYGNGLFFQANDAQMIEKEVTAKTSWRCWDFSFLFRERKGVQEFLVNVELQLDRSNREKQEHPQRESEFYPWRGGLE